MTAPRLTTRHLLWLIAVPLSLALLSPILHIVLRASEVEASRALDYLTRPGTWRIIGRSLLLVISVSLSSALIGIPAAWLVIRTDLYGRGFWTVLLTLPLVIPTYVGAFALIGAIGPRGFLSEWLGQLPSIYGFWGSLLSITLFTYPYVFLSVRAGLKGIDPALEEASRLLGQSAPTTFWRVTLPQLRPFILAGTLLVALYTLGEFGAVSVMRYDVFSRAIYFQLSFDRGQAALLSLVLVSLTIAVMAAWRLMAGYGEYYTRRAPRARVHVRLGRWQIVAQAFLGMIVLLALVLPLGVISYWLVNGLQAGEQWRDVMAPLQRSLRAASLTALVCLVAAIPLAFLDIRYPGRLSRLVGVSVYLGYALPGVVIGLALTFFGARYLLDIELLGLNSYRIMPLLIFAYMIRFLPQAVGPARAGLMQVSPHVEESALTLGRSRLAALITVTLPLMRTGLLAGVALVFLTVMKELPATLMLAPIGYETLATRIWSATDEAFYARAAAPALVLVLFSALAMVFILDDDD